MVAKVRRTRSDPDAYFLDASVLMYAAGAEHPLRDPCRAALTAAVELRIPLVTDAEVLQEILHRYFALSRPQLAKAVYRSAVDLCDEVLPVTERNTARALELLLELPRLSPRDAVHVATMQHRGISRILSTDRDFDVLPGVRRIDPGDFPA